MFSKPINSDINLDVTFTADDLDRTIAHYRLVNSAEKNLARALDEAASNVERNSGRLPQVQGPHVPTD